MKNQLNSEVKFIEKRQIEIDELIESTFKERDVTFDGIFNPEKYLNSSVKILWILKEVNNPEEGYNQRETINSTAQMVLDSNSFDNSNRKNWQGTLDPIIYISYQILNDIEHWSDPNLKYISESPQMMETIQKVAFINIKKVVGSSVSNDNELSIGYEESKEIIRQQIELIKPDVIIGGNTLKFVKEDYGIILKEIKEPYDIKFDDTKPERIFIESYHPQYLSRQTEKFKGEYFDVIVRLVKEWWNNKHK